MSPWYITTESKKAEAVDGWETVEGYLDRMIGGEGEFVVLEREPESSESYIQASLWTKGVILGSSFVVEVRRPAEGGFSHWRLKTKRKDEVASAFRSYFDGVDPVGPKWTDVTDEFEDF